MANLLTGLRLLLALPVGWAFADPGLMSPLVLLSLVLLAIASDYFDGIVARAGDAASVRGQLFDHATDCLFVTAGLAGLAIAGLITPLLPVLVLVAFLQYVLDSHYLFKQKQLRMSFLGRWNGILYFVPLMVFAAARLDFVAEHAVLVKGMGAVICYALILSTVASMVDRAMARRVTLN